MSSTAAKRISRMFAALAIIVLIVGAALWVVPKLEKLTYTLEYEELIRENAEFYDLDPYLVAAIIHCESDFRPEAESSKGAAGLMQIMPDTGEWIAEKLNDDTYRESSIWRPETNIRYGCWYLNYLSESFKNDIVLTLSAYNAGQGNVRKWLKDPKLSQNGTLLIIPYAETADYVKKVQHAYEKYQELYPNIW